MNTGRYPRPIDRHFCAVSLWFLLLLISGSALARDVVVLTSNWPPYMDPKLPGHGLAVSIVTEAFRRSSYTVKIENVDWELNLEHARSGEHGVIAAAYRSPERLRDFVFTDAYLDTHIKFLKRREAEIRFDTLEDLDGLRVGVVYEYVYEPAFDNADYLVKAPETHVVPNIVELLDGNIDLVVDDERTLRYELTRHFGGKKRDLQFLPNPLAKRSLHVAVSQAYPDHDTLVADFNGGLAEIRRDGTYRKLMRQANEEIWKRSYLRRSDSPH